MPQTPVNIVPVVGVLLVAPPARAARPDRVEGRQGPPVGRHLRRHGALGHVAPRRQGVRLEPRPAAHFGPRGPVAVASLAGRRSSRRDLSRSRARSLSRAGSAPRGYGGDLEPEGLTHERDRAQPHVASRARLQAGDGDPAGAAAGGELRLAQRLPATRLAKLVAEPTLSHVIQKSTDESPAQANMAPEEPAGAHRKPWSSARIPRPVRALLHSAASATRSAARAGAGCA